MGTRFQVWWQKISKPLDAVIMTFLVVLIALVIVVIIGYILNWDWTGINSSINTSITTEIKSSPPKITRTISQQPGKTLWDWLQLLIIPAVLAVGGYLFNYTTSKNEQESTEKRDQTERDIAKDNQREANLQSYIDKMSQLLLEKKLFDQVTIEAKTIARVRTLTTLPHLDGQRKRFVLTFLHEAKLLDKGNTIVPLEGADLSFVNLLSANLSGANLSGTILLRADLSFVDLSGANLSGANLSGAIVFQKQLNQVMSLSNANMPDGSKHP